MPAQHRSSNKFGEVLRNSRCLGRITQEVQMHVERICCGYFDYLKKCSGPLALPVVVYFHPTCAHGFRN
jgi:hypothetical protein